MEDKERGKRYETAAGSSIAAELPGSMNLETIIDMTGEFEHLNELVMLHLETSGGFTSTAAYFTAVRPILDLLETEIRIHYHPGMSPHEMKLIIRSWIDQEICTLQ